MEVSHVFSLSGYNSYFVRLSLYLPASILTSLAALTFSSLSVLFIPVCFRYLIDHGFTDDLPNRAYYFSIVAAVVGITAITVAYRHYQFSWLSERIVSDIRKKLFAHLLSLDAAQYETIKVGEMLSRLTSDTGVVQHILGTSVSMALRHVIQLGGALAMLFVTSFYLSCVFLLVVPALLFPVYTLLQKMRISSRQEDKTRLLYHVPMRLRRFTQSRYPRPLRMSRLMCGSFRKL